MSLLVDRMTYGGDGNVISDASASRTANAMAAGLPNQIKATTQAKNSSSSDSATWRAKGSPMAPPAQQVPGPGHVGGDGMERRGREWVDPVFPPGPEISLKSLIGHGRVSGPAGLDGLGGNEPPLLCWIQGGAGLDDARNRGAIHQKGASSSLANSST